MKELLERHTKMAVYRVTEGMKLQPNSVYLIPPGKNLIVEANLLRLEERKKDKNNKRELNFPIDLFFQSLAKNYGENAIGVILSGSGSDGTRGLRAINEAGGVTLVQDPETAEFDGMSRSATATGVADQVLPPPELARLIYQCIVSPPDISDVLSKKIEYQSKIQKLTELDRFNTLLQKEINIRQQAEAILKIRLKQQAAIASLGKQALGEQQLNNLFHQATVLVAQNLNVEYTKVLELSEDGTSLLLRAGVGWSEGLVGKATVGTDLDSQAGYTLISNEPIIVKDLSTETRFNGPALLRDHGVISGISTIIFAKERPFGVFGAHTRQTRHFSQDDVNFLQAIVNILATAINARHNQQTLQKSEKRFRSTFEQAAVGIAHLSPEGRFIKVNQRLCEIIGYESDRLLELTFQDITHPDDLTSDCEDIRQLLEGEKENYSIEKRYIHSNSSIVWINLTVSMVKDNSGEPEYFIFVIEDIGNRKKNELALEESRQQLERASLAKDSFIAHMSHELRTPLNSILGFCHILQQNPNSIEQQLRDINIINQSGQHLLTLINDILDFSKIEAGKLQLETQDFNLSDFLSNIVDIFQFSAEQKGLNFDSQISNSLPIAVKTDETKLRQVLINLLSNAIKFTETGSVTFSVASVEDFVGSKRHKIRFQVADTGVGIPKDKLADIFIPFQQLDTQLQD